MFVGHIYTIVVLVMLFLHASVNHCVNRAIAKHGVCIGTLMFVHMYVFNDPTVNCIPSCT